MSWERWLFRHPDRVEANLEALVRSGHLRARPNLWQVFLGVAYMRYRLLFRSETIGLGDGAPVRGTWRARCLAFRPLRFPFLVKERVIAPLDLTGLQSSPDFLVRHLLGAYHPHDHAVYDLELLAAWPDALRRLHVELQEVVAQETPRARWLADLVIHEGYHRRLLDRVEEALRGEFGAGEAGGIPSDSTLRDFLAWCLAQPPTPRATWDAWREGRFSLDPRKGWAVEGLAAAG